MNILPTSEPVQLLLAHPAGEGMVVSCYADTSVQEGFEPHWSQHLKLEATRVRKLLAADPGAREQFETHLDSIRRFLESPTARHAPGMAVFSASGWDEAMALPAAEPYDDRLVIDDEPYLVPLFVADYRSREFLVVLTDTHHGQVYAMSRSESQLLDELEASIPQRQHTAGDRHRKEAIHHYQTQLGRLVERAWEAQEYQGIILLGEHEVLEHFRGLLPHRLAERVVHEAPLSWSRTGTATSDQVRAVVDQAMDAQEGRLLDTVRLRLREGHAVATGPQEVINALGNGQVSAVILGPDAGEAGFRCTNCRSVFVVEESSCPYCKSPCKKVNLWQEILTMAARHKVAVHVVTPAAGSAVPNNIAALLLRDEPQWSPASSAADRADTLGA